MTAICRFTNPASLDIEQILDSVASQSGFDAAEEFLTFLNDCKIISLSRSVKFKSIELKSSKIQVDRIIYVW